MLRLERDISGAEILNLNETKSWLKVETTADDEIIQNLIYQSREILEDYCGIALPIQTITATTEHTNQFEIPMTPLNEILSVKSFSGRTSLSYTYDGFSIFITSYYDDNLEVIYNAGSTTGTTDYSLKLTLLTIISYLYENRGDEALFNFLYDNPIVKLKRKKLWI